MTHTLRIEKASGHNASASDGDGIFPVEIVRKRLWDAEITNPALRTNPSSPYQVQRTYDGGTTWVDSPADDPRHADGMRFPARTGSTRQCDAAANAIAVFKGYVDAVLAGINDVQAINGVFALASSVLLGISIVTEIIFGAVATLLSIGTAAISAAMTSTVYDQIEEIIFCHMDADGQVSAASLAAIDTAVLAECGSAVSTIWNLLIDFDGEVGLSNAGAIGTESGSCGGFSCCPSWFGGYGGIGDWGFWTDDGACAGQPCGDYESGNDRIHSIMCSNGAYRAWIYRTLASVSSISVAFDIPSAGGTYGLSIYDVTAAQYLLLNSHTSSPGGVSGITGRDGHQFIIMASRNAGDSIPCYINKVTICP